MEKARSMLSGAGLEQRFWAKAMATTYYLVNRSPTSSVVGKTPWRCSLVRSLQLDIFMFLVVKLMHMFQRRKDLSWKTKL